MTNVLFLKYNCRFHISSKDRTLKRYFFFFLVRISLYCNHNGRSVYCSLRMFTEDYTLFFVNKHRRHVLQICFSFSLELLLLPLTNCMFLFIKIIKSFHLRKPLILWWCNHSPFFCKFTVGAVESSCHQAFVLFST